MERAKTYLGSFSNFVGGIGYISVSLQWIWSFIPLLYPLAKSETFKTYFMPTAGGETAPIETFSPALSYGVEIVLIVLALLFAIGVTIYAIVAVPRSFGKAGKAATNKGAKIILPVITKHKTLTARYKRTLMSRISWGLKAILIFIPVFLLFVAVPEGLELTQDQFIGAGFVLAIGSTLLFSVQFTLSKLAKLPSDKSW